MRGPEEFLNQYRGEQLGGETLPERLSVRFELLACIHVTDTHVSFLIQEKNTGGRYLLKRSVPGQMGNLNVEKEQLARIGSVTGKPEMEVEYWKEGGREYLLRRYIEGQNLEEYVERNPVRTEAKILELALQICEALAELHHLQPPMIHRDIKPQNLILDQSGRIHLIDFEISRNFNREKQKDTRFCGTEATAAPEQYGYAQTDVRTDIYAFGKVLCYLLTGEYRIELCEHTGGRLAAIAKKCCSFDPKKRYQTIDEVKRRLLMEQKRSASRRKKIVLCFLGIAVSVMLIFTAGLMAGSYLARQTQGEMTSQDTPRSGGERTGQNAQESGSEMGSQVMQEDEGSTWAAGQDLQGEDLLYRAVAASLNLDKEEISTEDLQEVVRIAVIGTDVYDMTCNFNPEDMIAYEYDYLSDEDCGSISDISLLGEMKNLSEVYLYNQNITNIEALAGLPIRKLYLSGNQIEDIRVVEELPQLDTLFVSKNPIRYLPDFAKCPKLKRLVLDGNTYANLDCLRNSSVGQLSIREAQVVNGDYTFLEELPQLYSLWVVNPEAGLTEEISRLTNLRELALHDYRGMGLEFLESLENLSTLMFSSDFQSDISSLEALPQIQNLYLANSPVEDISVILNMKELHHLEVNETKITDLSPVLECKKLRWIAVDEEQGAYLEKNDPEHSYMIEIR